MKPDKLVIAFTCVGRRVQLVRHFRQACLQLGIEPCILGLDSSPSLAPAAYYCSQAIRVPAGDEPEFPRIIEQIVAEYGVALLVPLADTDLVALAGIRESLAARGCLPALCGPGTTAIARDKLQTFQFLRDLGLHTPTTRPLRDVLADRRADLPVFVKPRFGSAGKNAFAVDTWELPTWLLARRDEFVCQDRLVGQEVTVDLFVDSVRLPRCVVPRHRLEIRGGEVTKSVVRLDAEIARQIERIAAALPDAFGVINIQGFIDRAGCVHWTEINPRFGGGSPLAIEAGAGFPLWLVQLAVGEKPDYAASLQDGLMMLRFDDAVYVDPSGSVRPGSDSTGSADVLAPPSLS